MIRIPSPINGTVLRLAVTCVTAAGLVLAQDQTAPATPQSPQSPATPSGGWRRVGDPAPAPASAPTSAATPAPAPVTQPQGQDPSQPTDQTDAYGQAVPSMNGAPQDAPPIPQDVPQGQPMPPQNAPQMSPQGQMGPQGNRPAYGLPAQVTMQSGTYVTMRINQPLSSDRNLVGDSFSGTLMQPVVVNGVVVAQRGQPVYGRVTEVQKQKTDKPSRLGMELTGITLVDGTQLPVKSTLVNRQGGSTPGGVQAGAIVGTTAVGAAIGGAVGWGTGAAIGAGAGLLAGVAGVLATRNHPTIVYPETVLMFQTSTPTTIATTSQAFHYVGPNEYGPGVQMQMRPGGPGPGGPGYASSYYGGGPGPYAYPAYPYYPYPYPYYYPYYPYWGGVGVWFGGPRVFVGRGYGWGGGFRR
jgi:hypothetical protein